MSCGEVLSSDDNFMSELSGVTEYRMAKPSQVYFDNSVIFYYNTYCSYCFLEPIRFGVNSAFSRLYFGQEGHHFEFGEGQQVAFPRSVEDHTWAMASQTGETTSTGRPSTRRNRDYSIKITWTYDMNSTLYQCHLKANKAEYGYSGRMKMIWKERMPEYAHLTYDESIDLWKINVMQYTTAITLLARHGKLREKKNMWKEKITPGWISNFENKINAIRRKLSHVTLILYCKDHRNLTQKQLNIRRKLQKMYGNVKTTRFQEIKAQLTHELRVQSKILRDKKKIHERQHINSVFNSSEKIVYREFWKDVKVDV